MSKWEDKWYVSKKLVGGGQGHCFLVAKHGFDQPQCFLKVLKDNTTERRNRMEREIACYSTLSHPQIPKLINSNVEDFNTKGVVAYLVSEFVTGSNLTKYINRTGPLKAVDAIKITCRLLEIIEYTHSEDTVHRDIKPDNIILRNDNHDDPVLVDFGMSFYEGEDGITPVGQEVGNRFLRLPEFFAGSTNKRDPRSDVTQCAGILFFLLTGIPPRVLRDENERAPHQTPWAKEALAAHTDIDSLGLLNIFDRAFDTKIKARFDNAAEIRIKLNKLKVNNTPLQQNHSLEELKQRIAAQMEGHNEEKNRKIASRLKVFGDLLVKIRNKVRSELGNDFVEQTSGPTIYINEKQVKVMLGIAKSIDYALGYTPMYSCTLEGDDMVITVEDDILHRCDADNFDEDIIADRVRRNLVEGIAQLTGAI